MGRVQRDAALPEIARWAGGIMLQLQSAFGVFALLAIAWTFGENRRAVSLKQAAVGSGRHLLTAGRIDKTARSSRMRSASSTTRSARFRGIARGHAFVFGYLGGGALPFDSRRPARISFSRSRRCRSCW
jgi:CNT family concentrative nucleoside transporter